MIDDTKLIIIVKAIENAPNFLFLHVKNGNDSVTCVGKKDDFEEFFAKMIADCSDELA